LAVQRFLAGEKVADICLSLKRSRTWLYKWLARYCSDDPNWPEEELRRPQTNPTHTSYEIEQLVKMVRLDLYNHGLFCGAQAIRWELEDLGVSPLPSLRTINRILSRYELTDRRTGRYEPTGRKYPALEGTSVNHVHQSDFVGPCFLRGPTRFYSLNTVDLATGRCAIEPLIERDAQHTIDAFWAIWRRLGLPAHQQVDNEMVFYGSPAHPRGMGCLIRLCLLYGIELWFIPKSEPWRNGVVEKFNDHYRQKLLARVEMVDEQALREQSLLFEQKHNRRYRYSKLHGRTPLEALAMAHKVLCFPTEEQAPRHPLKKPESGKYHLVRFIRSDGVLDVFGEKFLVPLDAIYEYVIATIDVKEQKLKLYLDKVQIDELDYKLF
jgi:transposase InsO family protein